MKGVKLVAIVGMVIAIAGGLGAYWWYSTLHPSTQDSYVQANVIDIAAEVTGKVVAVHVVEDQDVKAGDPLFDIDDREYRNAVADAQSHVDAAEQAVNSYALQVEAASASIDAARAAADAANAQLKRTQQLFEDGNTPQAALDQARSSALEAIGSLSAAQASLAEARSAVVANNDTLAAAQAALRTAELNLSRTKIVAPSDGWVSNVTLRKGASVTAYTPLFALVDKSDWWVDANFKETDLARVAVGQPAKISVDMLPGTKLTGTVSSISRGSESSFSLLPAQNASGNWVKVTQRFKTRIALDETHPDLRVGASANVTINTTANAR